MYSKGFVFEGVCLSKGFASKGFVLKGVCVNNHPAGGGATVLAPRERPGQRGTVTIEGSTARPKQTTRK